MYREIYDYTVNNNIVSVPNSASKEIAAYINLDADGNFIGIDVIDKKNRKKVICPDIGPGLKNQGKYANPIVEKRSYMFNKIFNQHIGWLDIMQYGANYNEIVKKIFSFINLIESNDSLLSNLTQSLNSSNIKEENYISYRVDGINGESPILWQDWLQGYIDKKAKSSKTIEIISSITGKKVESVTEKRAPQINSSTTGTGAYVIAITAPSFESYGLPHNIGASLGAKEASDIKSGFEYLLSSSDHYNSSFSLLHWYDNEKNVEDLINESLLLNYDDDDDENSETRKDRALGHLLQCAITGEKPDNLPNTSYFLCQYHIPSQGRQYISNKQIGTYQELFNNLSLWYRDSKINICNDISRFSSIKILTNIYSIFYALMPDNSDSNEISKNKYKNTTNTQHHSKSYYDKLEARFGSTKFELINSIYLGYQIPRIYYLDALSEYTKSIVCKKRLLLQLIQIIKIYITRIKREENRMDSENETKAYACGELFALYEFIQKKANDSRQDSKKLNVSLTEKYFSAVQKAPQVFFPKLADLSIIHLKKISNESTIVWLNKQLGEVAAKIGTSFPQQMNDIERGEFILGYYNKKTELYSKSENSKNVMETKED